LLGRERGEFRQMSCRYGAKKEKLGLKKRRGKSREGGAVHVEATSGK